MDTYSEERETHLDDLDAMVYSSVQVNVVGTNASSDAQLEVLSLPSSIRT